LRGLLALRGLREFSTADKRVEHMAVADGTVEKFNNDELVVALADQDLVLKTIGELGAVVRYTDPHDRLGLVLVQLTQIGQAVGKLQLDKNLAADLAAYESTRCTDIGGADVSLLDLLLKGLRLYFADRFGWQPAIGKNRAISRLGGSPHVGGGGVGPPKLDGAGPLRERNPHVGGGGVGPPKLYGAGPLPEREPVHLRRPGPRVALLDGYLYPHEWLAGGYIAHPGDLLASSNPYRSTQGHATSVASRILDQAPDAEIHLRRVLDENALGGTWRVARAMAEIADQGFDVVNLSFGECFTDDGVPPLVLETAVRLLAARSVVVAAAGNHGNVGSLPSDTVPPGLEAHTPAYPAACHQVVAVGADKDFGEVADFTPKPAPWIRLYAPGEDCPVAFLDGDVLIPGINGSVAGQPCMHFKGWALCSGTSYAAANVTGRIAAGIDTNHTARQALHGLIAHGTGRPYGIRPA